MSLSLTITIPGAGRAAIERIRSFPKRVLPAIKRGMTAALPEITGKIISERLTGQGPFPPSDHKLGVKTGLLRKSVRWTRPEISGTTVTGSIGTNVKYAGVHEFGFSGSVQVKAHTRRTATVGGVQTKLKAAEKIAKRKTRKAKTVEIKSGQVRSHSRKVNIPERAPIRTGISDHSAILGEKIAEAVIQEANKK